MLYPVKVYDGEGNLLRIIGVDELKKKTVAPLKFGSLNEIVETK